MKAGFKSCVKLIGAITLFIVVMCAVLLPAVILPFTSAFNVASALNVTLPDTGVVGRNLLKNSDFSKNSKGDKNYTTSSTSVSIIDDWYLGVSGSSNIANYDVDSKTLTCSSKEQNGYYSNIWQLLDFIPNFLGEDIHFHVQLSSYTGNWLIQLWATNKSGSTVSLAQTNYQNTSSYLDLTYHVPLNLTSEYSNFRFLIQTRDTLSNLNVKCELGSAFTGWVPDYQDTIDDLQNKYDSLVNSLDWTTVRTLDLTSFSSSISGRADSLTYDDSIYYGYLFNNSIASSDDHGINGDFNFYITIPKGNFVRVSWDYFGPYNTNDLNSFETLTIGDLGENYIVYSTAMQYGYLNRKNHSIDFIAPFDISFINIYSSCSVKSGLFISGMRVQTRDFNFINASKDSYELGKEHGYSEGYRIGQEIGYANGSKNQGDYTFLGLIGSVVDAPLNSFRQMFDFEILGMNLSGFLLSLFSISLILVVVKLLIGR